MAMRIERVLVVNCFESVSVDTVLAGWLDAAAAYAAVDADAVVELLDVVGCMDATPCCSAVHTVHLLLSATIFPSYICTQTHRLIHTHTDTESETVSLNPYTT